LADRIVDLSSSGRTLAENNLVVLDVIAESTARLIVNRASIKIKYERITEIIRKLEDQIKG
ncbi:MAG TPA: ATP phosphoribosyltransferase, partial [Nitrospiria bacterium]|nr:ATP phosphoribosyltransferase [Nitrospiria bacterium]